MSPEAAGQRGDRGAGGSAGRVYALGDIHGRLDYLQAAHRLIATDRDRTGDATAPVVHLGDLVDRGPDGRGVIQLLIDGIARGEPWVVLRGNHDRLFADQCRGEEAGEISFSEWCREEWGGRATVESYGVRVGGWSMARGKWRAFADAVPEAHQRFMATLPLWHETAEHIFVHAGIRPGLELSEQVEDDLIWIRGDFLNDTRDHGRLVVHGHTPVRRPEHRGNRVNLDTGAGYGRPIVPAVIEGREVWVLTETGRQPLRPGGG